MCYPCKKKHELRMPSEEIAFTARPKINSHSQIFRYGQSIFCLPHRPNFSDIFDLCLHWMSVLSESDQTECCIFSWHVLWMQAFRPFPHTLCLKLYKCSHLTHPVLPFSCAKKELQLVLLANIFPESVFSVAKNCSKLCLEK